MGGWLFVKFVCKLSGVCAGLCDPAKLYRKKKIISKCKAGQKSFPDFDSYSYIFFNFT